MAAVAGVHTLARVDIDSNIIDQVQDFTMTPGLAEIVLGGDGQVDPTFVGIGEVKPVISFTTNACKTALAASALDGLAFAAGTGTFYFYKINEGGTRTLASNNIKMVADEGMLLPRRMSATQGQTATITYDVVIASTDGLSAIAVTTAQTVTESAGVGELYTVGECTLNGDALKGVQAINVDFGIREVVLGGDGQAWPTFVGIQERRPSITIDTHDLDLLDDLYSATQWGEAQTASDSTITFAEIQEGVAARGTPIVFTIDEGHLHYERIAGSHGQQQMATIRITPTWDGVAAIMVISGIA